MATQEPPPSSQSPSQPQSSQPPPAASHEAAHDTHSTTTADLQTYTSFGVLVLCPLLIALPPRKFDFYTVLLLTGTAVGGDHLLHQYTERGGIADRARRYLPQRGRGRGHEEDQVRPTAVEKQWQGGLGRGNDFASTTAPTTTTPNMRPLAVSRAVQELRGDEAAGQWGRRQQQGQDLVDGSARKEKVKSDWKAARDAKEREALDEGGKGYGGLIVDQIWEVWSWGRDKGRDGGTEGEEGEGRDGKK